jgi:4-diphosphocytidyl-2-C-methyl-D-erythritol kinase
MTGVREPGVLVPAYAKVNLCLWLGGPRADGRHELVTLFQSVTLTDWLAIESLPAGQDDRVVCEGVSGPNLVAGALAGLRAAGWRAPALRVTIDKRIPVAAGMGGGSADAAAMLRCAPSVAPVAPEVVTEIAARLGADVPGQLDPGASIGTGAGEIVAPVVDLGEHSVLALPQPASLSTAAVYGEADRLGLWRRPEELAALRAELEQALRDGGSPAGTLPARLTVNDLAPAARSLCPAIDDGLELARDAGADLALVCGSGPTVIGVFWGEGCAARAALAAERVRSRFPGAVAADPVRRGSRPPLPNL